MRSMSRENLLNMLDSCTFTVYLPEDGFEIINGFFLMEGKKNKFIQLIGKGKARKSGSPRNIDKKNITRYFQDDDDEEFFKGACFIAPSATLEIKAITVNFLTYSILLIEMYWLSSSVFNGPNV